MNKSLAVERIYSLGDYQNIKFTDTITEIPETIMTNPNAMKLLRYLQIVDLEWGYLNYMKLRAERPQGSLDEVFEFIENERTVTFEQLLEAISKK